MKPTSKLETFLAKRLKEAKRVAILAIGSEFRADDAAGLIVADNLKKLLKGNSRNLRIFIGATAPENLTGSIKRYDPSHIILLDSVEFKEASGSIIVLSPREIGDGVSFSTHKMPSKLLMKYFSDSVGCEPFLVGIQPESIEFGKSPCASVLSAAEEVARAISKALRPARKWKRQN